MSDLLAPDICVIGAGAAGLTVAAAGAAFGVSVVLVEKNRLGGECLYTGCVPSKALIAAAKRAHDIREAACFGVKAGEPEVDFAAVMAHVRGVVGTVGRNDTAERFGALGVTVLHGAARFTDRRTVAAAGATIRARRFVVATGSRPAVPPIPNLEAVPFLTNETVFGLLRRPAQLLVVGAGPTGLELAQAFRRLGSEVTVLDAGAPLGGFDPELTALLLENLRTEGIAVHQGVAITRAMRRGRNGIRLNFECERGPGQADGTHLLIAAGRQPNVEELGLAEAGIALQAGGIATDERLRTSNRRVYAIGDVLAGPRSTHSAADQAGRVVRSILFRYASQRRPELVPSSVFTDPELARVGWSEEEARRRMREVQVLRWPLSENDRSQTERRTRGLVKVVASKRGRILGVEILGGEAGELIAPWCLALSEGLSVRSFASVIFPYPTVAETAKRAALSFYTPKLGSPWIKRLIRFLRLFG